MKYYIILHCYVIVQYFGGTISKDKAQTTARHH